MKILLIRDYNPFAQSGASSNRWRTIIEGLANNGVYIKLIIINGYSTFAEYKKYGKKGAINSYISYIYTVPQLNSTLFLRRLNIYILSKIFNLITVFLINSLLKKSRFDYVFLSPSIDVFKTYWKIYSKNSFNHKLMIEVNEFGTAGLSHATNKLQKKRNEQYNFYLTERIFPILDICLVMTQKLLDYYKKYQNIGSKTIFFHLPMTVDLSRFDNIQETDKYNKPYIAYCGSSSFSKDGVHILIKSFAKLSINFPELKLYIAAFWEIDGPKMMKLISDLDINKKVFYLGVISREEIPMFIKGAKILALPRPYSFQAEGGFPTKLGEYLATGNPVCTTSVGEIPDYLKDEVSAFMAIPGDIDSFTNAMAKALLNYDFAKSVGKAGRKVAESYFSMDAQTTKLFNFLSKIAD